MLKDVKKGDSVILCGFTGVKLGVFEVAKATDKTITIEKKDGSIMIFSKKTGKQTNMPEEKKQYANKLMEDDGSYVPPQRKKKAKKNAKKKPVVEEVPDETSEEEFDDEYDDLDDDEE